MLKKFSLIIPLVILGIFFSGKDSLATKGDNKKSKDEKKVITARMKRKS